MSKCRFKCWSFFNNCSQLIVFLNFDSEFNTLSGTNSITIGFDHLI